MDVVTQTPARRLAVLKGWAIASMVANAALIITGGLVRLTKSGLGCPTWPRCHDSYLPDQALGIRGVYEFSNRLLTFVLIALSIATFIASWRVIGPVRRRAVGLAGAIGVGIIGQAVIGGLSVLSHLNPWVVGLHLLLSLGLVVIAVRLVTVAAERTSVPVSGRGIALIWLTVAISYLVMFLGTIVTGSGPNSGDDGARRNGIELLTATRIHSGAVWVMLALTIACVVVFRSVKRIRTVALALLAAELIQGAIGYWQYFQELAWWAVSAHMIGVALLSIAIPHLLFVAKKRNDQEN